MAQELHPERNRHNQRQWKCICDCGNTPIILQHSLVSGNTSKCDDHPKNQYTILSGVAYLDVSTDLMPGSVTTIDEEDLDRVINYRGKGGRMKWIAHNSNEQGHERWGIYVSGTDRKTRLHRLIIDADDTQMIVDHINGNTLDNRKSNLRLITRAENNKNMRKRIDNTSGATGVTYDPERDNYVARITLHGQVHRLGTFNTLAEANIAYRAAAKILGFSDRHGT